jgi:xanthine dehydrogenase accessory factor
MHQAIFQQLAIAAVKSEPIALGLISGVKGSSPQKVGAKAIFYSDGRIAGTMGGGCLEAEIQQRAIHSLSTGKAAAFDLLLDHDFGWDDGLICGGKVLGLILPDAQKVGEQFWKELSERKTHIEWGVTNDFTIMRVPASTATPSNLCLPGSTLSGWLYRERVAPPCALWIAGAGHIAQAVAPLAHQLDFAVTVLDDRPALVNTSYFPEEIALQTDSWENLFKLTHPQTPSFGLIVTRGHRHDALVLKEWIRKPFLFLGMIGSSRKARTIFEYFREEQIAGEEDLERVVCPVGIKIKSQTVLEISVSIMAQFIDKRAELVYERKSDAADAPDASIEN